MGHAIFVFSNGRMGPTIRIQRIRHHDLVNRGRRFHGVNSVTKSHGRYPITVLQEMGHGDITVQEGRHVGQQRSTTQALGHRFLFRVGKHNFQSFPVYVHFGTGSNSSTTRRGWWGWFFRIVECIN